mmetsp:Transcript_105965/g.299588  ORF Transcript_105965/g.299588 Transcript_105965/m.299588 type:complete len:162 (+) Transcript_105965:170-655(+)
MISTIEDAQLELKVVQREGKFINGLEWHLSDMLQQLEFEESRLIGFLAPRAGLALQGPDASGCEQGLPALPLASQGLAASLPLLGSPDNGSCPRTPPLEALMALDPLGCGQPVTPLKLGDCDSNEERPPSDLEQSWPPEDCGRPRKAARLGEADTSSVAST